MTVRVNEGPRLPEIPGDAPQYAKELHQALHLALADQALRLRALEQTVDIPPRKPNALTGTFAPLSADFLVKTANASLSAERVVTDTGTITWDWGTAGQAKANAALLTTKGDLWGYSTTQARIPVGTDGQVLTADSAQTLGVKWAAGGSGSGIGIAEFTYYGAL